PEGVGRGAFEPACRAGADAGQYGSLRCSSGHDLGDAVASPQAQQVRCGAAADVDEVHVEQQGRITVAPGSLSEQGEDVCVGAPGEGGLETVTVLAAGARGRGPGGEPGWVGGAATATGTR